MMIHIKKCLSLFAVLLLLLCSCSKEEPETPKTADMLNIQSTEESFTGCRERLSNVLDAMKAKVSVLEREHNRAIKIDNPDEYFLDKDYIHTAFDPFLLGSREIADGFTAEMNQESAAAYFSAYANGAEIIYESDGKTNFLLQFVSENSTKEYSAEYNSKNDSFLYTVKTENEDGETVEDFLEFTKIKNGGYVIQSLTERCYIKFDDGGNIISFCCGKLRNGTFADEESVFPSPDKSTDEHWVLSKGKAQFLNIHTFKDGVLTHEDCSSGPWKSIQIIAKNYESAFYEF